MGNTNSMEAKRSHTSSHLPSLRSHAFGYSHAGRSLPGEGIDPTWTGVYPRTVKVHSRGVPVYIQC